MRDSTTRSPAMLPDEMRLARGNAFLRRWLFVMAGLVFAMVVVVVVLFTVLTASL